MKRIFLGLVLALFSTSARAAELNWAVNGDFKASGGWNGDIVIQPGHDGKPSAFFENKASTWNQRSQRIEMPQPVPPAVEISGWLEIQDVVKGSKDWEVARITVVFFDKSGQRLGDWPAPIAQIQGTKDWDYYSNQYSIPDGTAWLTLEISLGNCVGRAWFSDLKCLVYDYDQKPIPRGGVAHPDRKQAPDLKSGNWLLNPGFETPGSSDWGQVSIVSPGRDSIHSMKKTNETPSWNLGGQTVSFQGKTPAFVVYSGWLRTKGVIGGKETWEAARLNVDFKDAGSKQLGGWQASVCNVTGDTDWTYYEHRYTVPAGAAQLYADAGLGNCVGNAWFDDLSLTLRSSSGETLTASLVSEQKTDTSDWYAFTPPAKASDTSLDLSSLNEKPAGKRGFVKAMDGHFAFADGTRIRFWGTNFVGPNLFLTHEQADALALRLSKLGVNLLRFHFLDNAWGEVSLFDPAADNTQVFLPSSLEKVEYLISALKKNGIYLYIDFSVGRKFRVGDGVPGSEDLEMGAKGVVHFSRKVIELNKKYAQALLSHVNPYTGMALKDDPAYVMSEIVNESSIFSGFGEQVYPQPFWDELQAMYLAWGGKGKVTHFKFDWDGQKLLPIQNPENETSSLKFLLETVSKSNLEMKAFLSKLSPHALLAGSNMGLPVLGEIKANSLLDLIDTHAYWDHPQLWNVVGGWANVDKAPFNNTAQIANPFRGSLLFSLSHAPVQGLPLFVSEWNDCFPNEWRSEGVPLMAAYGCLQDWDGLLQFDYGPDKPGTIKLSNFALNTRPDNEPLFQAGALIFRLGLLKPADIVAVEPISDGEILSNGSKGEGLFKNPFLPYAAKVVKKFTGKQRFPDDGLGGLEKLHNEKESRITSCTGEEVLDYKAGILRLDSPYVKGFVGELGGKTHRASGMALSVSKRNPWVALLTVPLDAKPIQTSRKFVVVAVAKAENSAQTYNSTRTALKAAGQAPILMQGVSAGLALRVGPGLYKVTPLDPSGKAGAPLKSTLEKGVLKFTISSRDRTAYYLVEGQ